jgi:hypothetical protein
MVQCDIFLERMMYNCMRVQQLPPSVSITKDGTGLILYDSSSPSTGVIIPPIIKHDSASVVELVRGITKKNLVVVDASGNTLDAEVVQQTGQTKNSVRSAICYNIFVCFTDWNSVEYSLACSQAKNRLSTLSGIPH